ncbi:MAG: 6-bladed beta-propeller [Bacteroidales bacterium]
MKRTIIISILLLLSVCCCTPKESLNSAIDLERNDSISIFDLVDSVSVIQLEKTEGSLMDFSHEYFYYKNRFYFMVMQGQAIYCFDKSGRSVFIKKGQGRGPEEFTYCGYFGVDPFLDQLMVLVPWGILINYDLDGKFISKTQLPPDLRAYNEVYAIDKDKLLFFTWGYDYYAYYYSKKDSLLSGGYVQTTFHRSMTLPPFDKSYYYKDSLYFNNAGVKNEILNMSDSTQRVVYRWDFGKYNYTEKQIDALVEYDTLTRKRKYDIEDRNNRMKERNENPRFPAYQTIGVAETERFRITTLRYGGFGKYKSVVLDKVNNKSYVFTETKEGVKLIFRDVNENMLIELYYEKSRDFLKKILSPEKLSIIDAYNPETDNPVLIIYHLK